ncbi:hypothetical protein K474DRAFT_1680434 [Panus rudis PR-1116 ss-1]|nr:hypothetical protein K474DRAFT_1680434 [Panus rudis PR-1116 ss-1]
MPSSATKLPSVTAPHIVAASAAMIEKVRAHLYMPFFATIREKPKTIIVVCDDETIARLTKDNVSTTGASRHIGYEFKVEKPGMELDRLRIWIEGPSEDIEVNRYYLLRVLQDIIENPHSGKTTFNGGAPYV